MNTTDIQESAKILEGLGNAFAQQFQVLYYIDLTTGKTVMIKGDEDAKKFLPIFNATSIEQLFDNFHRYYVDAAIVEEDRERVKTIMNAKNVLSRLKDHQSISINFRVRRNLIDPVYLEMRVIKDREVSGNLQTAIISFRLTEKEVREAMRVSEGYKDAILAEMLGGISLYLVDPALDSFKVIHRKSYLDSKYPVDETFSTSITRYINTEVAEVDRERFKGAISAASVMKVLSKQKEFIFEYRDISSGNERFYEMKAVRFGDNKILLGFADKDKEINDRMIHSKIEEDFFAMFGIDLDSETIKVLKKSPYYETGEVGESTAFAPVLQAFASNLHGDPEMFFKKLSDINFIKGLFATQDKVTYFYKSRVHKPESWVSLTAYAVARHEDGSPQLIAFGFSFLDAEASAKEESSLKLEEARRQLHDALKEAQNANIAKTAFLNSMSHDIRTPMNAIIGFTDLAKRHLDDTAKVEDCLGKIQASGTHLLNLINEVLEMSRMEAGKIKSEFKTVSVAEEVRNLITICQETAAKRNIKLTSDMSGISHWNVTADELHINQVLMNILGNAIKYTMPGGNVSLTVTETDSGKEDHGRYRFVVEDTGIGMSKEFLAKIFDSFSREDTQTVSSIQGTGLGMSIVKRLVDYMGGTIDIESEQGRGTKVTVILDLKFAEAIFAEKSFVDVSSINLSGRKVLLVEDNELNREIAGELLKEKGIEVTTAVNGLDAIECIKGKGTDYFDWVLMDIQMPQMDGYEATAQIRKLPGADKLIIIALSANAFKEDKLKSREAGMDDHVAKPIDIQQLIETLAKFI